MILCPCPKISNVSNGLHIVLGVRGWKYSIRDNNFFVNSSIRGISFFFKTYIREKNFFDRNRKLFRGSWWLHLSGKTDWDP